jgi:hypothetical protein
MKATTTVTIKNRFVFFFMQYPSALGVTAPPLVRLGRESLPRDEVTVRVDVSYSL